jgi:hypothetical protein
MLSRVVCGVFRCHWVYRTARIYWSYWRKRCNWCDWSYWFDGSYRKYGCNRRARVDWKYRSYWANRINWVHGSQWSDWFHRADWRYWYLLIAMKKLQLTILVFVLVSLLRVGLQRRDVVC